MVAPNLSNIEPLLAEVEHFADCLKTGARPTTNGVFGTTVVRILEAVVESIHEDMSLAAVTPGY